jgi:hypothetical protein
MIPRNQRERKSDQVLRFEGGFDPGAATVEKSEKNLLTENSL